MEANMYQAAAMRTANNLPPEDLLMNGILGLNGEAGEVADVMKKHMFQGHELDREKIIDEAGDCMWYIAAIAEGLGITISDIMRHNVEKLQKRYPDGFDSERSVNREE